jgi:hypothetical protein
MTNRSTPIVSDAMIEAGIRELNWYDGEQQAATVESIYTVMHQAREPDDVEGLVEALREIAEHPGPNACEQAHHKAELARAALEAMGSFQSE